MTTPDDYNVIMMPFPGDILAAVRVDATGYPTIYINDYLSPSSKQEALRHELAHILRNDLTNHLTIYDAEKGAVARELLPAIMTRSFRDLTDAEAWGLLFAGVILFHNAFDTPLTYTEPIAPPMFDRPPKEGLFHAH